MHTAERGGPPTEVLVAERGTQAQTERWRRAPAALAGPVLIVASVLVALRGFAFQDLLSNRHPDVLSFWLPRSCLMGRSLAAGHVPLWNPFEMAGTPFAADPQSGWLYVPMMLLSRVFGCGGGLRAFIVVQPLLAGLGLYWFLRRERLHRVAATAGGISLAMIMAASNVAIQLPFAGALAWTPYALVGASGFLATASVRRYAWLALAAFAWGQVAAAHMSHGLVMCTALVFAYVLAHSVSDVHGGRVTAARAAARTLAFLAFLPLASLALLIPHFALAERSSLRLGYAALSNTLARSLGVDLEGRPLRVNGVWSGWPLALASAPGAYAGAAVLLSIPAALRDRGRRYLLAAFAGVQACAYVLTLDALVSAPWFRSLILAMPFGDVYLHDPGRLRYVTLVVAPVLGALGLQSFIDRLPSGREALWWLGSGAALFLALPIALGADPLRFLLFALGIAATVPALIGLLRSRRWAVVALPGVLAAELLAGAIWSSTYTGGTIFLGLEGHDPTTSSILEDANLPPQPLRYPQVPVGRYLTPGPIARHIQQSGPEDGRYLAWIPPAAYFNKGYLWVDEPKDWPALLLGRAVLFGLDDALGYSPIQLPGYWTYIRATNDLPVFYNASAIQLPSTQDVRLLGVRYLIEAEGVRPTVPGSDRRAVEGRVVASERGYELVEVDGWQPRVSVVPDWTVARSEGPALAAVLDASFDPGRRAVVEGDAPAPPSPQALPGSASYHERWPEDVLVTVRTSAASVVVVRNAWDTGWSATVDGRPTPVLRADSFLQGVVVPAGAHRIRLMYHDPTIGLGLVASAIAWSALGLVSVAAVARERRRRRIA